MMDWVLPMVMDGRTVWPRSRNRRSTSGEKPPSEDIPEGNPYPYESRDTTHFSVADAHGNAVSNTYTLSNSYGRAISLTRSAAKALLARP